MIYLNRVKNLLFCVLLSLGIFSCSAIKEFSANKIAQNCRNNAAKNSFSLIEPYATDEEEWYDAVEIWQENLREVSFQIQTDKDLSSLKQPSDDAKELIKMATEIEADYYQKVSRVCYELTECSVKFPPAGGKSLARLYEKVKDGAFEQIFDYSRATVVVSFEQTIDALQAILKVFGKQNVYMVKNRILSPAPGGYRDIRLVIYDPTTTFISELLLLSPQMLEAKSEAHDLYKKARTITDKAEKENRALTRAEAIKVRYYTNQMQIIYDAAYEQALIMVEKE
jgi:hypothetical protein